MKRTFLILAFLTFVLIYCCGDDNKPTGGNGNTPTPDTNILKTDEFGNILGGDSTDWCFINNPSSSFGPVYPNPCIGPAFSIKFKTTVNDTIKIYFLKSSADTIVIYSGAVIPGYHVFMGNVSGQNFENTFQRLYLKSNHFITGDSCKNYGDIKFEP
jgi:hypothetical protein